MDHRGPGDATWADLRHARHAGRVHSPTTGERVTSSASRQLRRDLRIEDLNQLAETLQKTDGARAICGAIEGLSGQIIGHRLFTIMRFDSAHAEVERVHSSLPSVYPVGGRKKKTDTKWADHVLHEKKVFRGTTADDIRAAFDDHKTILGLGLGSIINIPIVFNGRCLGTMNLQPRSRLVPSERRADRPFAWHVSHSNIARQPIAPVTGRPHRLAARRRRRDDHAVLPPGGADAAERPRVLHPDIVAPAPQAVDRRAAETLLNKQQVRLRRARILAR